MCRVLAINGTDRTSALLLASTRSFVRPSSARGGLTDRYDVGRSQHIGNHTANGIITSRAGAIVYQPANGRTAGANRVSRVHASIHTG